MLKTFRSVDGAGDPALLRIRAAESRGDSMKQTPTLLIADDSATNRMLLHDILGDGYTYLYAENGVQTIELLEQNPDHLFVPFAEGVKALMEALNGE